MLPYLVDSGKMLDDMGFPDSCVKNQQHSYNTVIIEGNLINPAP